MTLLWHSDASSVFNLASIGKMNRNLTRQSTRTLRDKAAQRR